jgi:hypothetical protein
MIYREYQFIAQDFGISVDSKELPSPVNKDVIPLKWPITIINNQIAVIVSIYLHF